MNTYSACIRLNIWSLVKARAEVWAVTQLYDEESLNELKVTAKKAFHSLCMDHHPDKGGEHENYLEIQKAFDLIKGATHSDFVNALDEEKQSKTVYFEPGSEECSSCRKWSDVVNTCITVTCSGFDEPTRSGRFANIRGKNKFSAMMEMGHANS